MSQIRLYLDEDAMRRTLVFGLRARSVDIPTASDAQMVNRDDSEQLLVAARPHAGIIVAQQQRYPVGEEIKRIVRLLGSIKAEHMGNRIEFLSAW
jgi:hypothetical protein